MRKVRRKNCEPRRLDLRSAPIGVSSSSGLRSLSKTISTFLLLYHRYQNERQLRATMFLLTMLEVEVIVMRIFTILYERSNKESRSLIFSRKSTKDSLNAGRDNGYRSQLNAT